MACLLITLGRKTYESECVKRVEAKDRVQIERSDYRKENQGFVRLVIQALCAINGDWEGERRIESSRTSQKECGIEDGARAV